MSSSLFTSLVEGVCLGGVGFVFIFAIKARTMTREMQNQDRTTQMGCGRVRKVMVLRTSEEVKQTRMRERQRQRYQAMQQTMLQAVEQAVALPEIPVRERVEESVEPAVTTTCAQPTEKVHETPSLKMQAERVMGSIASWMDRMRVLVLEEG